MLARFSLKLQASKVAGLQAYSFIQHRCFPVNIAKFLRTVFYRTPLVAASLKCSRYQEMQISGFFVFSIVLTF